MIILNIRLTRQTNHYNIFKQNCEICRLIEFKENFMNLPVQVTQEKLSEILLTVVPVRPVCFVFR